MPHLITNRRREFNGFHVAGVYLDLEGLNAVAYLVGGVVFTVGSVLFLPKYEDQEVVGAWLFVVGSFLYTFVALQDLWEARKVLDKAWRALWVRHVYDKEHGTIVPISIWKWLELIVALVYSIAAIMFIVGSFLFVPEYENVAAGSWLFVWGSVLYGAGACINMLQVYLRSSAVLIQLLMFTAAQFLCGSILFIVGSVVFLLDIQDAEAVWVMDTFAAWLFIAGGILFTTGAITNAARAGFSHKHERKIGPNSLDNDIGTKTSVGIGSPIFTNQQV